MSIDMSQFHQVFFEESLEGLDIMENGLLELPTGPADDEAINTIFRAAHSIKGGSGTFGFTYITDFTHIMETLLDEMRDGKREVTQAARDLLLRGVDVLREMLSAAQDDADYDEQAAASVHRELEQLLTGAPESTSTDSDTDTPPEDPAAASEAAPEIIGWRIVFAPQPHLLKTGNDPLRLFRELSTLGELSVSADCDGIPPLSDADPEECYLSWTLELSGTDIQREQIDEIFEWVEDDADLVILPLLSETPAAAATEQGNAPEADIPSSEPPKQAETAAVAEVTNSERRTADRRKTERRSSGAETSSIRVGIDKVDSLINMVGELVITQSMLGQFGEHFDIKDLEKLRNGLSQLERNTRELQETVMQIRMLPISFSFNRFPRLVHDLSQKMGKKIELKLTGEQTELDKTVMEKIGDPLVHLVRNSIDHGIEMPEQRLAAGKGETGILELKAYHEGGNIIIEIIDDGAGLNRDRILDKAIERGLVQPDEELTDTQIHEMIFRAGFSTAASLSDISGRGVGMDVVRRNIKDLGGVVEVRSKQGEGSTFTIKLPLTLAILDGQLVSVGEQTYIIPLISIIESLYVDRSMINSVAGKGEVYKLRDEYIPIIRLYDILNVAPDSTNLGDGLLVIVEGDGCKAGLFVDDLLAQQQVVIKSLESNYQQVEGISGATILGDGRVALILDISGIISLAYQPGDKGDFRAA